MRHFDPAQASRYRKVYNQTGIIPLGLHSGGQFWNPGAAEAERRKLKDSVEFARDAGFRWLVVSGNKDETPESMKEAALTYAKIGRMCRQAGLGFAYHNHNWELADDAAILDVLVRSTPADDVKLVLDIAWAHIGAIPLSRLMDRFGDRIAYLHIKDVREERFCELGEGEINLPEVFELAGSHGIEWMVVEQDYSSLPARECMSLNRRYLESLGW
jgi:sugar phosphate isomerase/epimerase